MRFKVADCCDFKALSNNRIQCVKHKQCLLYGYDNGVFLCQLGEDNKITELGWDGFFKYIDEQGEG